jgi:hypothetical protein
MPENDIETPPEVRAYMGRIAQIMTPAVLAARRANAAKAAAARRHPSTCTCGRNLPDPLAHAASCRIYQAEKARRRRAKNSS